MNKIILIAIIILSGLSGNAQIVSDTIFVSETSYAVFPQDVDIADVGDKTQFVAAVEGKTVFFKAKSENAKTTTYLIKMGDDYFTGYLVYKKSNQKPLYDFRNIETKIITTTKTETVINPKKTEAIDTVKLQLKNELSAFRVAASNRYKTIGTFENSLYFALSDLRHNSKASYIKLKLSNQSSVAYVIDHITFEIYEGKTVFRNEVEIFVEDCPRQISGKEDGYMYFALPLLSIPENCELKVTLRERGGLRTITFYIPSKTISSSATF